MKLDALRHVAGNRCFNHAAREAVARCVACGRTYCRECVAEHDGRMICASCLRRETRPATADRTRVLATVTGIAHTGLAIFVAWCCFYGVAQLLLELPSPVHEGSMWTDPWLKPEEP